VFDQRAFIAQVERANVSEFARLLVAPTYEQEQALRAHFGDDCYQRLSAAAMKVPVPQAERGLFDWLGRPSLPACPMQGNVVLLPGIMGSELSAIEKVGGQVNRIWLNLPRIALGQIDRLSLASGGTGSNYEVRATGILKSYYGSSLLALARRWQAQAYWYDWRKNLDDAADQLRVEIDHWFGSDSPVHLVAHSMGGLVCRSFIKRHPDRWKTMWDSEQMGQRGGRLVMLGTPNYGSYLILQAACGLAGTVRKLALVDQWHNVAELIRILNTFIGSFQMLPSPQRDPAAECFYDAKTYGDLNVPQSVLDLALSHHASIKDVIDGERMVYIAGSNRPTLAGLSDPARLRDSTAYLGTTDGDGSVTHALGLLKGVRTYFIEEEHSALTNNAKVLAALDDLLQTGKTEKLAGGQLVRGKPRLSRAEPWGLIGKPVADRENAELSQVQELSRQLRRRIAPVARGTDSELTIAGSELQSISLSERKLRDLITSDFLSAQGSDDSEMATQAKVRPTVIVRLFPGRIDKFDALPALIAGKKSAPIPVDAVAVGHYIGVRPQAAELALDRAISGAIFGTDQQLAPSELILTQYTERGLLRGELGTTFFLPIKGPRDRVLAVAGMGPVGGCGAPELTVLVRELCWALSRYGKKHLATLLIGSGNGNLSVRQCVEAWVGGLKQALDDSIRDHQGRKVRCVTFVELDLLKIRAIQTAILEVSQRQNQEIGIEFEPLTEHRLTALERRGQKSQQAQVLDRRAQKRRERPDERGARDLEPTRLTVEMTLDPNNPGRVVYRFGALTATASLPERAIVLNRVLVEQANDELAGETDSRSQRERGQFLGGLLIPHDLRPQLSSTAPLVIQVDATTARIHWEMVAQPDPILPDEGRSSPTDMATFLGTYRGLTRQLRTTFARPPQPARNHQEIPRVLVVADPCREYPLRGAADEGLAVASLFESFNTLAELAGWAQRFQVTRLIGPIEATPTRVLRELSVRRYDVLHYAGHCFFDPKDPTQSGWIFSEGIVISAFELQRIDRVPPLVISNACESGITPDRSGERSAALLPSFAESFFAQGVTNYVGTAWPVDDIAARLFATTLYGSLIGIGIDQDGQPRMADSKRAAIHSPQPMHLAILQARLAVARSPSGHGTWGAYQHYGNPNYRILPPRERT
jgi:pimeloyl-ACP methyl ester carboxylesterase